MEIESQTVYGLKQDEIDLPGWAESAVKRWEKGDYNGASLKLAVLSLFMPPNEGRPMPEPEHWQRHWHATNALHWGYDLVLEYEGREAEIVPDSPQDPLPHLKRCSELLRTDADDFIEWRDQFREARDDPAKAHKLMYPDDSYGPVFRSLDEIDDEAN